MKVSRSVIYWCSIILCISLSGCGSVFASPFTPTVTLTPVPPTTTPFPVTATPFPTVTPELSPTVAPSTLFIAAPIFEKGVIKSFETTEQFVVLTVDDGYSDTTLNQMLDLLEQRNVHASFFFVGNAVTDSLKYETLKRLIDDGNEIGYHSMRHPALAIVQEMTIDDWNQDYSFWQTALLNKLGDRLFKKGVTRFVRAPYGEWTDAFLEFSGENNLVPVNWTANEFTFEPNRAPIRAGGILLLHTQMEHVAVLKQLIATDWAIIKLSDVYPQN